MASKYENVAARYAEAVLELAYKSGADQAQKILADLNSVNQIIVAEKDLGLVLSHPSVPAAEKKKLLVDLFSNNVDDLTMRLLELLLDKRRMAILPTIAEQYLKPLNSRNNIETARLTSAESLSAESVNSIKTKLAAKLGRVLELDVSVDASLIGGIVLTVGDQVIDGSLKGKLQSLEKVFVSV